MYAVKFVGKCPPRDRLGGRAFRRGFNTRLSLFSVRSMRAPLGSPGWAFAQDSVRISLAFRPESLPEPNVYVKRTSRQQPCKPNQFTHLARPLLPPPTLHHAPYRGFGVARRQRSPPPRPRRPPPPPLHHDSAQSLRWVAQEGHPLGIWPGPILAETVLAETLG